MSAPSTEQFRDAIRAKFEAAEDLGHDSVTIRAGELHAEIYGESSNINRMPVCCSAMIDLKREFDRYIYQPPSGKGPNLEIEYRLPR
jgi:hypothetical protein